MTLPTMDPKLSDGELALAILLKLRRMINQPPGCGSPRVRPRAPCVPTRIVCALCVLGKIPRNKIALVISSPLQCTVGVVVIRLKEANHQRCRPGRRRNARQGHTSVRALRLKIGQILAPRTSTSDIRGEIVPGDGASLVSLFLDSLSLPTSPLATTMVSSLLSVLVVVSTHTSHPVPHHGGTKGGNVACSL